MSKTLEKIRAFVQQDSVTVSRHGYQELASDSIPLNDIMTRLEKAVVVEDYPDAHRGPSVLTLQHDSEGRPVHVVWGIPSHDETLVVLITAYRPDPLIWSEDFLRRNDS